MKTNKPILLGSLFLIAGGYLALHLGELKNRNISPTHTALGKPSSVSDEPNSEIFKDPVLSRDLAIVVKANGETVNVSQVNSLPNGSASFARVYVQSSENLHVKFYWPELSEGSFISVLAMDGGQLMQASGKQSFDINLLKDKVINFDFRAGEYQGLHRVIVRSEGTQKELNFWVGQDLPVILHRTAANTHS